MSKSAKTLIATYSLSGLLLLLAHNFGIWQAGFFDYDSARNWQVVQEINRGNFHSLFHHASPTFFLFYAPFTTFLKDFHYFIILNSLFNIASVLLLIRFVTQYVNFKPIEIGLLILFTGCATFTVASSRYFTIEAPSLFIFTILLIIYYKRFSQQKPIFLQRAAIVLAIGLTVNYKFILVLPVMLAIELWHLDRAFQPRKYFKAGLILIAPYLFYAGVAIAVGLPFYRLPATIIKINDFLTTTPGSRTGRFNFELTYYFRYLWHFESPLLLAGILLFPVVFSKLIFKKSEDPSAMIYKYLFAFSFLSLAGMHLLLKSPRGLLFCYSLFFVLTYLLLKYITRNHLLTLIIIASSIVYQVSLLQKEVYRYSSTQYPQVVKCLKDQKIKKLITTVGLGITPFTQAAGIEVKTTFNEKDLPYLKRQGFSYVLLDDYYLAANIRNFKKLEKTPPLALWAEPSLLPPLLYLDQCEFTGLSFLQALQVQKEAKQDKVQLRLLPIK